MNLTAAELAQFIITSQASGKLSVEELTRILEDWRKAANAKEEWLSHIYEETKLAFDQDYNDSHHFKPGWQG